jgi:aspartokinase/homoserine dehydrogenase 1
VAVEQQPSGIAEVMAICNELSDIARGASLIGEVTPRTKDLILSFGERLSAYVVWKALKSKIPDSVFSDARGYIKTDEAYGHARINFELTNRMTKEYFSSFRGTYVVTGFIGSTSSGQTTTLGRSGSDYTASIIGAALDAEMIEIWSDADGVMTADPGFVKEARSISHLSYSEAMELSHFGAKILFPSSMQPAMEKQIPVKVKNTFNPDHPGTLITGESRNDNGFIKGISSLRNISIINVEGSGMVGVAGISSRLFNALSKRDISVILISQASSEHSICIAVPDKDSSEACRVIQNTFSEELDKGLISSVYPEDNLAIVAVVGENMRHMPGVAARVFNPLGRNGINVKAISQGSSELNISFIIHENDLQKALRVLHQTLFSSEVRRLHLYVAGTGSVGGRLLDMIKNHRVYLAQHQIELQLSGLINSKKMIIGDEPVDPQNWRSVMKDRSEKASMKNFIDNILFQNNENSVFVDVTAADEPVDYYQKLMSGSVAIVAANKRANTRPQPVYEMLHHTARKRNIPFHYETNVGAGLPVINTIRNLMHGGDKILKIEAVLSGTINWLLSEYDGTKPFSELVKIARERGYTEPDPRDDLSGMDVARKCLILARESGIMKELSDIVVNPLMPDEAGKAAGSGEFFRILQSYDSEFSEKYSTAIKSGHKLRYIGLIENGKATVGLTEVDEKHPFFGLAGSENCLIITTEFYSQYPMVIKGPGAGVNVTAAGLLADIVRIAEEVRI